MNDIVSSAQRDQVFHSVKSVPENKFCLDCEKKNPSWCSIYFGIHLCMDCAGKHRQYGVMYSFVKSANLDSWTMRQLQFMVKGGNARALEYLRKCGAVSSTNKAIDYKSPIVQKYKEMLTAEVDGEGVGFPKHTVVEKQKVQTAEELNVGKKKETNLHNHAQEVKEQIVAKKGKGKKKIQATKINIEQFDNIEFDNGISKAQKDAMIKASQSALNSADKEKQKESTNNQAESWSTQSNASSVPQMAKVEAPKWVDEQTAKETMEKLKQQKNLKNISSDSFMDSNLSPSLQQNLQKLEGKTGFGSSELYGQQPEKESAASKIKNVISDYGEKLYDKISKYMKK